MSLNSTSANSCGLDNYVDRIYKKFQLQVMFFVNNNGLWFMLHDMVYQKYLICY